MSADFENQLERQTMREPPRQWRAEILAAAASSPPAAIAARPWRSGGGLSSWLWPHPRAWAGLAAAWAVILLLHVTAADGPRLARNPYGQTRQSIAIMQQRTLMMAQLLGSMENDASFPALPASPKPRSERPLKQLVG
jgi:hypothetical protein